MNGTENSSNGGGEPSINNAGDVNKSNLNLQTEESFYQKENKTLNVNVLAEESEEMQNNEITFDSEKFAKSEAKSRPRGTIENNLAGGSPPTGKFNRIDFSKAGLLRRDISYNRTCTKGSILLHLSFII